MQSIVKGFALPSGAWLERSPLPSQQTSIACAHKSLIEIHGGASKDAELWTVGVYRYPKQKVFTDIKF